MAASVVSVSGRLCSSSALLVECSRVIDQRSSSGATLGFIKERPALRRRAGPSSAALALALSSRSSRSFRAAAVYATKQKRRGAILHLDDDEEEDDDDKDDGATAFPDMEAWMRSKPPGFGLKEYDTSLEDRLLADLEAERAANAAMASKKKLKKPGKATEKQDAPPQGVEVYVGNLPRKRNVDRDLRAAFRSAQGLLHIRPIVDANEKTREPMCKGLAFLTFASDNEAKDFIRRYNGEGVRFGKTEKKVVCDLAVVNSPFKKQVSQKQGADSPRLQIRDITPSSPSKTASSSPHVAVELVDTRHLLDSKCKMNSDNLEGRDEDIDSVDVLEDELLELEQEIWAELEDEDDLELDRELGGDGSEDPDVPLTVDSVTGPEARNDVAQDTEEVGQIDIYASDSIHVREAEKDVITEDEEEEAEAGIQEAERSRGRGFGLTPSGTPDAGAAAGDKDKRIQELESKLKQLEVQLKKRETKAKVGERNPQSEERIEALEKRLLARARPAPEKDSKINPAKSAAGSKKPSSKVRSLAKGDPCRPKIGVSKRLRKKERQIYTGVLSKYSPLAKEVSV